MKKRTPEEKARKEAEDIAKAEAAVENIKKPIRDALSFIKDKMANFINRIKKRKGDSAKDWAFIGEKIGEGLRAGAGIEETPHYEIKGVDLAEPEQQPKENPYAKPALEISADVESIIKGLEKVVAAYRRLIEMYMPICKELSKFYEQIIEFYPNKRVVHLAKHARKERVRKKNINRILKWYARGGH